MPKPSLQNRSHFKTWLRYYKDKFTSNIQVAPEFYIDDILTSKASGISTTDNVSILIVDNRENISITTAFNNDDLIYIPALSGDTITVGIGTSSLALKFGDEGSPITYDGVSYSLGDSIAISTTRSLSIRGLGGLLLQGTNTPTYSVGVSTTIVSEGQSVDFTVSTEYVPDGATLYFNTATSMEAADFSDNSLTGSFNIIGVGATAGVATVTRTIANDFATEGQESFSLTIRTGSSSGTVVATSSTITVNDVVASFSVAESSTSVNEGGTVTFTVTGSNIPNGTYYYSIEQESGIITASDFNPVSLTGSFNISSNTGTFTITIADDFTTDGSDSFSVDVRRGSVTGTVVASSNIITINDTSRNVGSSSNGLTFGPVQVNRDNGNAANTSDWYTICDLDNVPDGSSIALFIDGSGSMTQAVVQASYELLVSKLAARNITITTVTNSQEDWITPFLVDLP